MLREAREKPLQGSCGRDGVEIFDQLLSIYRLGASIWRLLYIWPGGGTSGYQISASTYGNKNPTEVIFIIQDLKGNRNGR